MACAVTGRTNLPKRAALSSYNVIAALAVIGAVIVNISNGSNELAFALVGLAGTIAGRGKNAA